MQLDLLHQQIKQCTACGLCEGRTNVVPGEGPERPRIMFIGEGPGFHEDKQGRPFVGPAGKFLEELLATIDLTREEVYITNIIKCRPPGNRDPLPEEVQACNSWMEQQIELLAPELIVTLGRHSMARFFPTGDHRKNARQDRHRERPDRKCSPCTTPPPPSTNRDLETP